MAGSGITVVKDAAWRAGCPATNVGYTEPGEVGEVSAQGLERFVGGRRISKPGSQVPSIFYAKQSAN
jgi:hypothetical protein